MAERSFAKEVLKLKAKKGEVFHGEGILAITKALLQSGVSYIGGYQGAPISHLMDVFADAQEQGVLSEFGVNFESSASEATAAAMLSVSVNYPLRGAVAFKSTVGTNVASDALANLASGGVKGGSLVIVGEDYGEGSSIMQERTHSFAMKSQMWLIDPKPNLQSMVDMVEKGFELSEYSNTPVFFEVRLRACHAQGTFVCKDNVKVEKGIDHYIENPERDLSRIVLPPASFLHEDEKIKLRYPKAVEFIKKHKLNEITEGKHKKFGVICQGGMYNTVSRVLTSLGLSDIYGDSDIPIYTLNVTYPIVEDELLEFCKDKDAVIMIEEGQPNYIEQNIAYYLRKNNVTTKLHGKDLLPLAGEYSGKVVKKAFEDFIALYQILKKETKSQEVKFDKEAFKEQKEAVAPVIRPRPPGFCTGCPERPIFSMLKMLQQKFGNFHISGDIGCHIFSILPPFNIGNTTMGYGLGTASLSAFSKPNTKGANPKKAIAIMGDGGFWHNGLSSGVGNAVFNKSDSLTIIVDNGYSAATGGQAILSSVFNITSRSTKNPIEKAVRGVGVEWVKTIRSYDIGAMREAVEQALKNNDASPKVIIAQSECMLNKQRREKPKFFQSLKQGIRVVRERLGVDGNVCTGDHECIRLSGCPSLTVKDNPNPLKVDPVAYIDQTCVGCGNCGEVAHNAVLCPSFYKVSVVENPSYFERLFFNLRSSIIRTFQS